MIEKFIVKALNEYPMLSGVVFASVVWIIVIEVFIK